MTKSVKNRNMTKKEYEEYLRKRQELELEAWKKKQVEFENTDVRKIANGKIIECCEECPFLKKHYEDDMTEEEAMDKWQGNMECGSGPEIWYYCHHEDNYMEEISCPDDTEYFKDLVMDDLCPLEDAPEEVDG